jgi:hypothetical protein
MISIHAILVCATAAGWPCHAHAIRVDTVNTDLRAPLMVDTTTPAAFPVDTPITRRPKAIQYSDWYARRLLVHRLGSYTMLPLFAAEWSLGQNLLQDQDPPSWMRGTHRGVAAAIGVVFTVNTVTGAWNLWDSRHDPASRTRRYIHAAAMLASDAGFIWAGAVGGSARRSRSNANTHRAIALTSIGVSTAGTAMMWFWRN